MIGFVIENYLNTKKKVLIMSRIRKLFPKKDKIEEASWIGNGASMITEESADKLIIDAMNNSKYRWRTIEGISTDVELPASVVMEKVYNLNKGGLVIKASSTNENGDPLFTTAEKYEESTPLTTKIVSSFTGKIL